MRAKYQVLVLPYYQKNNKICYAIFKRSDMDCWQFIAGGGESEDRMILASAQREAFEEAGISKDETYTKLETTCSISTEHFQVRTVWGKDCLVIPEYSFAVEVSNTDLRISREHTVFEWVDYSTAVQRLRYDSNKVALWELDNKLKMRLL